MIDYGFFAILAIWGLVQFLTLGTWTLLLILMVLPRIRPPVQIVQQPTLSASALPIATGNGAHPVTPIDPPGIVAELKQWATMQPGRFVAKADVIGMIVGLQQQYEPADRQDPHEADTALSAFGGS